MFNCQYIVLPDLYFQCFISLFQIVKGEGEVKITGGGGP